MPAETAATTPSKDAPADEKSEKEGGRVHAAS